MSRIFLSHSALDVREALALKRWLVEQEPPLANEIFLDVDPDTGLRPGQRWKNALQRANARCEAVICLLSPNWAASHECKVEYRLAENLNKQILCARLAESAADQLTSEWQRCDLFGDGQTTSVDLGEGPPVVFATKGLYALRDEMRGAGISTQSFVWPPPDDPGRAPYRGWEPFERRDAAVFFGRDRAILTALDELRGMRQSGVKSLFVVLGPSGAGKSSFLRAGLLPRLARDDRNFMVLGIVRPGRNPLTGDTGLAAAIADGRAGVDLSAPSLGEIKTACATDPKRLRELLAEVQRAAAARLPVPGEGEEPSPPTLILPVDQAEELFADGSHEGTAQFLSLLGDLLGPDDDGVEVDLIVAATIRTDRYEQMQTHAALSGLHTRVFDDLKPMPPNQFREVIVGPAERATQDGDPLEVAPALVDRLLSDAAEGGDALPMLSLTLAGSVRRLRQYRRADSCAVRRDGRDAPGGAEQGRRGAFDHPDRRRTQLDLLRSAFIPWLATVDPERDQAVRRVAAWTDLPAESWPLIDALVEKRLMVKDTRDGQVVVEVALESLLRQWDELAGWLAMQRADLVLAESVERAAAAWKQHDRQEDWLLTGTRLTDAEALSQSPGFRQRLSGTVEFLAAARLVEDEQMRAEEEDRQALLLAAEERAKNAQERESAARAHGAALRTRSRITAVIAVLAVLVAIAAVVGFVQAGNARTQAQTRFFEATSARLVSEAQAVLAGTQPGSEARVLQLLLAADALAPGPAEGALYSAVIRNMNLRKIIDTNGPVVRVAPGGARFASIVDDETIQVWDAATGNPAGKPLGGHAGGVLSVALSPDGSRVVSGSSDDTVRVWDASSGDLVGKPLDRARRRCAECGVESRWVAGRVGRGR